MPASRAASPNVRRGFRRAVIDLFLLGFHRRAGPGPQEVPLNVSHRARIRLPALLFHFLVRTRAPGWSFDRAAPEMLCTLRRLSSDEAQTHGDGGMNTAGSIGVLGRHLELRFLGRRARCDALACRSTHRAVQASQGQGAPTSGGPVAVPAGHGAAWHAGSLGSRGFGRAPRLGGTADCRLPETCRGALQGHLLEGLPPTEMAERRGIAAWALHVRVHRGPRLLRGTLPAAVTIAQGGGENGGSATPSGVPGVKPPGGGALSVGGELSKGVTHEAAPGSGSPSTSSAAPRTVSPNAGRDYSPAYAWARPSFLQPLPDAPDETSWPTWVELNAPQPTER